MSAPDSSKLDNRQMLQGAYDEANGLFRTSAQATIVNADIDVALDATEDNVAIANAAGIPLKIENNGSINTNSTTTNGALETTQQSIKAELISTHADAIAESNETQTILHSIDDKTIVGTEDAGNSTITPLGANGVFTGTWVKLVDYSVIAFSIFSDVASATGGLSVQWSSDGVNIDRAETSDLSGNTGRAFALNARARYFRIVYTNGATPQTTFRLATDLHTNGIGLITRPLSQAITDNNYAQLVTSVTTGKNTTNQYVAHRSNSVSAIGQNSSTTPLLANATYTGQWEDVLGFANIGVTVIADVASATNGLRLEYSTNGVDIDDFDEYTVSANNGSTNTIGVTYRYFRVRYTNGTSNQSFIRLSTIYLITAQKPSSHRIDDSINGQNDAELSKAVLTGKNPNNIFVNTRAQGIDSANSSSTLLNANSVFRGIWFPWTEGYTNLQTSLQSDVSGTLYVDFSEDNIPVDGSDVSISTFFSMSYDPSVTPVTRRKTPLQSKWVRQRYVNGPAAQSTFYLTATFLTNDSGLVTVPLNDLPTKTTLSGVTRSIATIPNSAGTGFQDIPVDTLTGNPKSTVSNIRDDILLRPLATASANQIVIGTTPIQLDSTPVANRRSTLISNEGPSAAAIGFSNSITFDSGSMRLPVGAVRELPFSNSVSYWGIAQNTGGVQTTLTRSGTTATGTATNPSNALTSDNVYTNITAAAQNINITGYTAGTSNSLVSVKLGIEANKQSGQTETVTFQDIKTGSTAIASGTVSTSASVTAVTNHFYIAAIGREANATITGVTGLGLTWSLLLQQNSDDTNRAIDIWYAQGTVTTSGIVTASFSTSVTAAHISVSRYSNVSTTSPIQASIGAAATSTTPSAGGVAGTTNGMSIMAVEYDNTTVFTPGVGYTTTSAEYAGEGIGVIRKPLVSTGTDTPTSTINASKHWAAISLTLTPAPAIDPQITLSYELSAVAGATSGIVTVTSSTDTNYRVDITADRVWVPADIANVKVIATGTTISAAAANVDYIFIELVDTTGNTTRLSIVQGGEATV